MIWIRANRILMNYSICLGNNDDDKAKCSSFPFVVYGKCQKRNRNRDNGNRLINFIRTYTSTCLLARIYLNDAFNRVSMAFMTFKRVQACSLVLNKSNNINA